ncbi:auxin efflux carrier [Lentinus tigrinus ALCF2SS1-7]|uniref:auxin efflux carrier n=1 Tax=Lentinus tigrinus ALCF2SS1-7 TaxID=1328758 RepID=UPI00116619FE|nr:auxin efflux carrier [Lentinus tigrinus ALCF2SS1-7]
MTVSAAFLIYSGIMPLIKTFAALLCGYVLVRMDMFPPAASRGASLISMNVALPALIFANIVPSFTPSNVSAMGPVVLIAMVYMLMGFVMGIIIRELCYVPRNFWQGIVIMTGMSNWGNLPNAIVMSVTKLPPFDPATDPALGVSYVSIFTVCYHIVFWMCGAASSLSWDYLPGVPQGEEAERRVSWKEKPIGRLVARMLRLSSPPPAPLPSELAIKDEEAFPSRDEKGSIETSEQSSVQSPRIVVVEEPQEENDVQLTSRISPLGMSNNQTRRLTIVIPPSPRRGSVPPTPMRPSVPPTPRFATAPSSPLRSVYPISPARSIAAITPIRTIHSIHSLEDPVAIAALIEQSAPPQHRSRIARFFAPFAALLKPVTISLAISLPIALITPLKALFVDATAQGGPDWHGPDGRPPLAFVMDSAQFIDTIAVPLTLILLGASFARIQLPNPLSRLPIMAMLSVTLAKMVILPVIGVVVVEAMVRGRLIPEDAKAEKFVAMLLSGTPAAVNQMIVSSLYAPDGDVDTLSAFLLVQYVFMSIASAALTAVALLML